MKTHRIFSLFAALLLCSQVFAQSQEIHVYSHRGGRLEHDENTLQAFAASYEAGYNGFEIDIRMTKDGELVIMHDSSLERTSNGTGTVEEQTAAELRRLKTKGGNDILFLDEFLEFLSGKPDLYVEFEMKTKPEALYPEDRLAVFCDKLYKAVMENRPTDALYIFTSNDYRGLRYLQAHYPDAELLVITTKPCNDETIAMCKTIGIKRLGATMNGTSRESVRKAHKEGLIVSLWPGYTTDDFMLGAYLGADYMCTDIPIALKEWFTEKTPWLKVIY
jgi:glycerophosphoryl diester phosphodiesterase